MRCLLVGNYGDGNFGDEALKEYFCSRFSSVEWVVVSARPQAGRAEIHRLPSGIRSFFGMRWWEYLRELRRCDAVVFGGGTLFTDVESVHACVLWWMHAFAARLYHVPRLFCFQGIGPFTNPFAEWLTKSALKHACSITVRDAASAARAVVLAPNVRTVHTFDPILSLFTQEASAGETAPILAVVPRAHSGESFASLLQSVVERQAYTQVRFLSLQPENSSEQKVIARLQAALSVPSSVFPVRTVLDMKSALTGVSLVLTHRYHGAIAALGLGVLVQVQSQEAGDKLSQVADMAGDSAKILAAQELIHAGEQAFLEALRTLER